MNIFFLIGIVVTILLAVVTALFIGGFVLQYVLDKLYKWGWIKSNR